MENNKMQHLLDTVSIISKKYDDIAKITGENFNIFTVMRKEWDEVYTHSAIIGELLNPKGSHNQDRKFQDLFIDNINEVFHSDCLQLAYFDTLVNENICERTINISNDWENMTGGRIDLIIEDRNQIIIIENKPGWQDQPMQLIRYTNYAKTRNKPFKIFYLTLNGRNINDEEHFIENKSMKGYNFHYSKKDEFESFNYSNNFDFEHKCIYYPISFEKNIKEWLEKCLEIIKDIPTIYEPLLQYLKTVKKITNQPTNNKMSEEIEKLITVDNVNSIIELNKALNEIKLKTEVNFIKLLKEKLDNSAIILNDKLKIYSGIFEDDGFYLGFQLYDGENLMNESSIGMKLTENIKSLLPNIKFSESFICWYVPEPFEVGTGLEHIDNKLIVKLFKDDHYLESIVQNIANEFNAIRELLKKSIV